MTLAAALKRKLAITLIRTGRAEATFAPIDLRPFAKPFQSFFKALVMTPITAQLWTLCNTEAKKRSNRLALATWRGFTITQALRLFKRTKA